MIVGRTGDPALLDGLTGLSPCVVKEVRTDTVVVDFDDRENTLHWSDMCSNPWRNLLDQEFPHRQVIPVKALLKGEHVLAFRWEPKKN